MGRYTRFLMTGLLVIMVPLGAWAGVGLRIGTGISMVDDKTDVPGLDDPEVTPFAVGLSYQLSLVMFDVEANALYWQNSISQGSVESESTYLALPVIARASIPIVPALVTMKVGGGVEPRFHLGSTVEGEEVDSDAIESMVMYMPIVLGAQFDLQLLSFGLDIRYEYQLTDHSTQHESRINQLMFFGGANF